MKELPTRREFITGIWLLAGWAAFLKLVAKPDTYKPAGYVHARDAVAHNITAVTLDGKKMEGVFEADDVEGWLRRFVKPLLPLGPDGLRYERLEGQVRFQWR